MVPWLEYGTLAGSGYNKWSREAGSRHRSWLFYFSNILPTIPVDPDCGRPQSLRYPPGASSVIVFEACYASFG